MDARRSGAVLVALVAGLLLLATFLIRALHAGQPIVENYVGRQVPTAMVARNLDRGSGFLRPQLDTAPFPNYFLVEPPIYESGVVVLKRADRPEPRGGRTNSLGHWRRPWRRWASSCWHAGAKARSWPFWPWPPSPSFPSRSAMDAPSSPTPPCWGPSCWAWPAGIGIDPAGDGTGSRPAGRLVALGFAIKITAAFLLIPLVLVIARARSSASDPPGLLDASAGRLVVCVGRSSARIGRRLARFGRQPVDLARARRALRALEAGDSQVRGLVLARASVHAAGRGPGADRPRGALESQARTRRPIAMRSGWSGESRHWSPWRFSRRNCITSITGS